jgi:hypothetical protein
LDESLDTEIRSLHRSLERLQGRITSALEAVAKEISQVQQRLRKRLDATQAPPGVPEGGVPPAWPPKRSAATSRDSENKGG